MIKLIDKGFNYAIINCKLIERNIMTKYYVYNEEVLCYDNSPSSFLGVLMSKHNSIHKNGDNIFVQDESKLREATKKDFDEYNVCWKGHLKD